MRLLTPVLYPFAVLYDAVTSARNRLYDLGLRPVASFDVPVISVGNLSVGGTGKTPMVEYLIRLLADEYNVATLSRGYGRATRGMRIARDTDNAVTIGDEPLQFYRKFGAKVTVAVGEERALAIPWILDQRPETDLILLDDAFQHRAVKPVFQILLTDFNNPFFSDYLLPAGRLRESRAGAARANVVVVTKCPHHVSDDRMMETEHAIRRYTPAAVFFTRVSYGSLLQASGNAPYKPEKIVLVTGIAKPAPMVAYLRQHFNVVKHFAFPDHHAYTARDADSIAAVAVKENAVVVTTEKDVAKLGIARFDSLAVPLQYLPIETEFLKNGNEFEQMVINAAKSHGK